MTTNNKGNGPAKSLEEAKARIKNRDRGKIKANTNKLKSSPHFNGK